MNSSGFVYDGMFKDGKFNGDGVLIDPDGNVYKGNFVGGKRLVIQMQGIETLYFDDQTQVKDGFFIDDNFQQGTIVITYTSGIIDTDEYKDFNMIKSIRKENQALVLKK